jgi:hypothetical protein
MEISYWPEDLAEAPYFKTFETKKQPGGEILVVKILVWN